MRKILVCAAVLLAALLALSASGSFAGVVNVDFGSGKMKDGSMLRFENGGYVVEQYQTIVFENLNLDIEAIAVDLFINNSRFDDSAGIDVHYEYAGGETDHVFITVLNSVEGGGLKWFAIPLKRNKPIKALKFTHGSSGLVTYLKGAKLMVASPAGDAPPTTASQPAAVGVSLPQPVPAAGTRVVELSLPTGWLLDGGQPRFERNALVLGPNDGAVFDNLNIQLDAVAADISLSNNRFNDSLGVTIVYVYADGEIGNVPITVTDSRETSGSLRWFGVPNKGKAVKRIGLMGGASGVTSYVYGVKLKVR